VAPHGGMILFSNVSPGAAYAHDPDGHGHVYHRAGSYAPGRKRIEGLIPEAYAPFAQRIFTAFAQSAAVTKESDVAHAVWRAANDSSGQLHFPAGADAMALARPNS